MTEKTNQVVRFAPSPTGLFHIGSVRTALFNFLFAKKNDARFILRFEDTDTARSKKEFEKNILDGLDSLGITFDETYHQSERTEIYEKYLKQLLDADLAYVSAETEGERSSVIRFRNPNTTITFVDLIRGEVTFDTTELGDFVIAKSETEPLYNFAVVVDDAEMGVTEIIRGEDHISNTPRQILILEAIGRPRPNYAHIPMILAPDRSKMSKRHGAVSVTDYLNQGFLPIAILNYLALLGWNPGGEKEVFSLDELIDLFDLSRVHKSGAIFSLDKLRWFNSEHLKRLPEDEKGELLLSFLERNDQVPQKFIDILRDNEALQKAVFERAEVFSDIVQALGEGEYDYLYKAPTVNKEQILSKVSSAENAKKHLVKVMELLEQVDDFSMPDNIRSAVWDYATEQGRGEVLWPTRTALSGKERSLDPFTIAAILGKIETLARLSKAAKEL